MQKIFLVLIVILAAGCANFPDDTPLEHTTSSHTPVLFPLNSANNWKFQSGDSSTIIYYSPSAGDPAIYSIVGNTAGRFSEIKNLFEYLRNQSNGLVTLTKDGVPSLPYPYINCRFEFPTQAGAANNDRYGMTTTCTDIHLSVPSRTGTHVVWRYTVERNVSPQMFYTCDFIPDTGLLRLVSSPAKHQGPYDTLEAVSWLIK